MKTMEEIAKEAHEKGMVAGTGSKPTPMIVGTPTSFFGNDLDPTKPQYFVEGGACGFAWIKIRPARGAFVSYAKKNGIGHSAYGGGYSIWVSEFGQSIERKEAYARAYATVLTENGIKAHAESRLD